MIAIKLNKKCTLIFSKVMVKQLSIMNVLLTNLLENNFITPDSNLSKTQISSTISSSLNAQTDSSKLQ